MGPNAKSLCECHLEIGVDVGVGKIQASPREKLATASFKTDAEDKEAEALRMLEELEEQAKENIR